MQHNAQNFSKCGLHSFNVAIYTRKKGGDTFHRRIQKAQGTTRKKHSAFGNHRKKKMTPRTSQTYRFNVPLKLPPAALPTAT